MKSSKKRRASARESGHDCACTVNIRIKSSGTINIYNCAAPARTMRPARRRPTTGPVLRACPGACVPPSLGAKPKQSRRNKLDKLLANNRVPSTLGASVFHLRVGDGEMSHKA